MPTYIWHWIMIWMLLPVINKIDLPSADPQRVIEEIEDVIGIEAQDAPLISAKTRT